MNLAFLSADVKQYVDGIDVHETKALCDCAAQAPLRLESRRNCASPTGVLLQVVEQDRHREFSKYVRQGQREESAAHRYLWAAS